MLSTTLHLPGGHLQCTAMSQGHQHLQRGLADKGEWLLRAQQLQHGHLADMRGSLGRLRQALLSEACNITLEGDLSTATAWEEKGDC